MKSYSFIKYNENEEEVNGDYQKFIDASEEEIENINCRYSNFCEIILQIKNPELKEKMKRKVIELLNGKDLLNVGEYILNTGLFNDEDIKKIISTTDYVQKIQDIISKGYIRDYNVLPYIRLYFYSTDKTWVINNVNKILTLVKDYDFYKSLLITTLEIASNKDKELFEMLFNTYKSELPEYYLNYIKIKNDSNYLYNKSLEYKNMHLKIGIDPKISIAPEIEANNNNGLTIDFYAQNGFAGKYFSRDDATVPNGKEINCIPFHDTEESLASFKAVCDGLKEIGYYYSELSGNASGQINLGLSYLDSAASIINFYEIFGNVEELLFYISNKKGQLTRQKLYQNSRFKPIGEILGTRVIDEDITRDEVIRLFNSTMEEKSEISGLTYKKNTVCLRGYNEKDYRFEIRIPNGGVDYETWIDNIRLYGKMMEVSKKIADASAKEYLTEDEERVAGLKLDLEDKSLTLKEKLDILMNLLFDDEEIKKIYYERFDSVVEKLKNSTDYQEIDKYYVPYRPSEPMFDEVEFQGKYKSKIAEEPVGVFDTETNEYIEYGKKSHL